ncbi:MAG: class I SAM-dependent methyltransferase [Acidobacteria bacterium]|nr:class I SAM-dependent methyltransferase [Acidobacteriota bacterium]MBI3657682.1 class I SAM-dependent methyltransferase [Acidobacteriota bacterium]
MRCPVCGSVDGLRESVVTDLLLGTTKKLFQLIRCSACTARYLDPQPSPDELMSYYPNGYWGQAATSSSPLGLRWIYRLEQWYKYLVLTDHVRFVMKRVRRSRTSEKPTTLLDVGCGSGAFLDRCRRKGFTVRGMDASRKAAQQAAQAYGIDVIVGSIDAADRVAGAPYDVITMFHVLEHLCDPVGVLQKIAGALTPLGDLIVQVPNGDSLQARGFDTKWYGLDPPRHLVNFNLGSMRMALARAGFAVQAVRHFSLRDNAPALVSSFFPNLDPLARAVRGAQSRPDMAYKRLLLEAIYFIMVLAAQPAVLLESWLQRGATLMVHAKKESR